MNEFEKMGLDESLLRSLADEKYVHPFPIQEKTIPSMLEGKEIIGQAKTGSGKTAAFALPILHMINYERNKVQAIILAPTRELAVQIADETSRLGRYKRVKVVTVYGGQPIERQIRSLQSGAHIVVGTPGRVIDMLKRRRLSLDEVRFAILDEGDRMLDMGFIDDVEYIFSYLPKNKQLCIFSATMPEQIISLSKKYMREPVKIMINSDEPSVQELEQFYTFAEFNEKFQRLLDILKDENPSSAIIFCRTKAGAKRLSWQLERKYFNALSLHGDLTQNQREGSLSAFKQGKVEILVATDVASRGIDIRGVEIVINYDFPEDPMLYFHRVGRTARAGASGKSISILTDENIADFFRVQRLTKSMIKPVRKEDETRISSMKRNSYAVQNSYHYTRRWIKH
jgi:ATP-dependent RNA helicase DeaD